MTQTPSERFSFNGTDVPFVPGQSIAAALTQAGISQFRETAKSEPRGIFCGMGVCQDCLVTIDGVPNTRACMTQAKPGLRIKTQVSHPSLSQVEAPKTVTPALKIAPDVLIIGGGAAGLSAAIAARAVGAEVVVFDERKVAGGQFFKQSAVGAPLDRQQADGQALLARAQAAGAQILSEVQIWAAFDGPLILAEQAGRAVVAKPRQLIVATGAYERPEVVPGWTLPGVMTTGAAQTLWRSYKTLAGKRVAIFGSGPLNLQVGQELMQGGAEVCVVAERASAPWSQPVRLMGLVAAGPGMVAKGLAMYRALRKGGVAVRYDSVLQEVLKTDTGLLARYQSGGKSFEIEVDAVLINAGFEPQNEILRLLGVAADYDPSFGHMRVKRDALCATSLAGVFAIGDCAGLGGALAAQTEGEIAGRAAAAACGFGDAYDVFGAQKRLSRHRQFQRRLWAMHDIAPRVPQVPDHTIICRCEELTAGQIRARMAQKPGHLGTLKRATRLGMGRCQGRYCGPMGARIVAAQTGEKIADRSFFAPRVPIKPVAIATILAAEEAMSDAK